MPKVRDAKARTSKSFQGSSHVVSFRLSDDAYQKLKQVCRSVEGATPSEFAREMVSAYLESRGVVEELGWALTVRRLGNSMTELRREVERLLATVGKRRRRKTGASHTARAGKRTAKK